MKILFFGAKGWLGSLYVEYLKSKDYEIIESLCRTDNYNDCEKEIQSVKPTHIVDFSGRTHGVHNNIEYASDYLELPGKLVHNINDNLFGPLNLALLCELHNIHYTFMGTGCIFNYDKDHPFEQELNGFTESDLPNFFDSSYSTVKGFTDRIMHKFNVLNLRVRMPIHDKKCKRNFLTKITSFEYVCSIKNSWTVLNDMWPVVEDLMRKYHMGTVNLTNPGLISHNEILELYKEIVDPCFTWKNFTKSARANNYLDTSFLEKNYPEVKHIRQSVIEILGKYDSLTS